VISYASQAIVTSAQTSEVFETSEVWADVTARRLLGMRITLRTVEVPEEPPEIDGTRLTALRT